jgi:hypothetical protein
MGGLPVHDDDARPLMTCCACVINLSQVRVVRASAWLVGSAALVLLGQMAAQGLGMTDWTHSYCCGSDQQWPLNIATAAWVTGSAGAITAWLSARRNVLLAIACWLGSSAAGLLVVWYYYASHLSTDGYGLRERPLVTQLVAAALGTVVGLVAARWRVGVCVVAPIAMYWAFALTSRAQLSDLPHPDVPLGLILKPPLHGFYGRYAVAMYVAVTLVGFVATVVSARRGSTLVGAAVVVAGFGLTVVVFRLAGVSQSPDHSTALIPYTYAHRMFVAAVIAAVIGYGVAALLSLGNREPVASVRTKPA